MLWNESNPDDLWIEFRAIKQGKIRLEKFKTWQEGKDWSLKASNEGLNSYYGVAYRKEEYKEGNKENCGCTSSLWVDVDRDMALDEKPVDFILPPSTIICSGKGQHIYWQLTEPVDDQKEVEKLLKKLATIYKGDKSCAQFACILRVPGTFNYKYDVPKPVYEVNSTGIAYSFNELQIAINGKFDKWLKDARKYVPSGERSEHEYKLVNQLFEFGFTSSTISYLVKHHTAETSKANEDESNLEFTIAKVEEKKLATKEHKQLDTGLSNGAIFEGDGCYCAISKEGNPYAISNFVYDLKAIQSGMNGAFICDIVAGRSRWERQVVEQKIFSSELTFKQNLPYAQMSWYGDSKQTMKLKQLLADEWEYEGLPLIQITKQVGRQYGDKYVVTDGVYDKDLVKQEDILYVEPGYEHPNVAIYSAVNPKQAITDLLKTNDLVNMQTMLGWFVASYVKPVLLKYNVRFPHLLVCGTQGSGKTTLITEVFQKLVGYKDIQLWQANSTPFVLLTLLGASTSIPVCLTEFRDSTQKYHERFLQLLRSAYDSGKDARGTQGQVTNSYQLSSPICIDGEHVITDPALLERLIPVYLDKRDVAKAGNNLAILKKHDLRGVGGFFLNYTLQLPDSYVHELYVECLNNLEHLVIPQRIKNNYAVVNLGLKLVSNMIHLSDELEVIPGKATEIQPATDILTESSKSAALEFLQDLIIYIMSGETKDVLYRYKFEKGSGLLGFHLGSCYSWWTLKNRQLGRDTPPKVTLRHQFEELDNIFVKRGNAATDQNRVMFLQYVSLSEASKILDIDEFN